MPPRKPRPVTSTPKPVPLWAHPRAHRLVCSHPGPFITLDGGHILTINDRSVVTSPDAGKSWESRPLFPYGRGDKEFKFSNEAVLLRTAEGTVIFSFMNINELVWGWRDELRDILPGTRLPHYVVRSTDEGQTWQNFTHLHDDWTGEIRNIIQTRSGRIVMSSMKMLTNPGRHATLTYWSDDQGQTWHASHLIDLGGSGHHGGVIEATIEELTDGRLWMLLRTNWGRFWQAFSHDQGQSWREVGPSNIPASSAPGLLKRLASGRLLLLWNRPFPEGKTSYPLTGGDGLWSETPVSNHRGELSLAFSEDDGKTFTDPVVLARQPGAWLSYPRVYEHKPGQLWVTTMQGDVRLCINEEDFV